MASGKRPTFSCTFEQIYSQMMFMPIQLSFRKICYSRSGRYRGYHPIWWLALDVPSEVFDVVVDGLADLLDDGILFADWRSGDVEYVTWAMLTFNFTSSDVDHYGKPTVIDSSCQSSDGKAGRNWVIYDDVWVNRPDMNLIRRRLDGTRKRKDGGCWNFGKCDKFVI